MSRKVTNAATKTPKVCAFLVHDYKCTISLHWAAKSFIYTVSKTRIINIGSRPHYNEQLIYYRILYYYYCIFKKLYVFSTPLIWSQPVAFDASGVTLLTSGGNEALLNFALKKLNFHMD